jgi:MFS family permease
MRSKTRQRNARQNYIGLTFHSLQNVLAMMLGGTDNPGHSSSMPLQENHAQRLRTFAPALLLIAIAILINYVDRGNLSVAAPLLREELHLSPSRLGLLFSAFFYTYTAFIFLSGWLVDKFNVNHVFAAGFFVWSIATAATGLARGFALLFAFRLLLGIGESVAFPASSKILARHVAEVHRGFANGLVGFGMNCGPALGTLGAGLLMAEYGWRYVFLGIGLLSLLWLPAWLKFMPKESRDSVRVREDSAGYAEILTHRSFWGASAGHFCTNYLLYFMVTWLPTYLVQVRHLSVPQMAKTASAYYLVVASAFLCTGLLTDAWIRRGATPTLARKTAMVFGHAVAAVGLVACAITGPTSYLPSLAILGIGSGVGGSGTFVFPQILAGPRTAGRWVGLQNGFGNLAGVVGPTLTGFLVEWTGSFTAALLVSALVSVVGAICWTIVIGPLEEVQWPPPKVDMPVVATTVEQI